MDLQAKLTANALTLITGVSPVVYDNGDGTYTIRYAPENEAAAANVIKGWLTSKEKPKVKIDLVRPIVSGTVQAYAPIITASVIAGALLYRANSRKRVKR